MRDRLAQELVLLQHQYGEDVEYREAGEWFLIPRYPVPAPCYPRPSPVCFNLRPGYPGIEPYGFFVSADLRYDVRAFNASAPPAPPLFPGAWLFFSWASDGWTGTGDVMTGSNLWAWVRSFAARLSEGP